MKRERISQILEFLSKRDKAILLILILFQMILSLLDLIGVGLIGGISILAVGGTSVISLMKFIDIPLTFFGVSDEGTSRKILILGVLAAIMFTVKTITSIILVRRMFKFLSIRATYLARELAYRMMYANGDIRGKFKNQELAYALTTGTERAVLGILGTAISIISDLFLTLILIFGLFLVSPILAFATMLFFVVVGLVTHRITSKKSNQISNQLTSLNNKASSVVIESNMNIRDLVVRGRRSAFIEKFVENRMLAAKEAAELSFLPYIGKYIIESSIVVGALMLTVSQFVFLDPTAALGTIAFFLGASSRIAPAILRIQQGFLQISISDGLSGGVFDILSMKKILFVRKQSDFMFDGNFVGNITVKELCFKYNTKDVFSLNIENLNITEGSHTVIVGNSGSGKSTLVDLCLGILEPTEGHVTISGFNAKDFIDMRPGFVGYVPQNVVITEGTIRDNILLGFPKDYFPQKDLNRVLYLAVLDDFVNKLTLGIDSPISEWGGNLSGGQKQRLGVARALITNPKILFLDEATSAMDSRTESIFHLRAQELGQGLTIVVVAHKLTTIREADNIVFMDSGEIRSTGSFDDLYRNDMEFKYQMDYMSKTSPID